MQRITLLIDVFVPTANDATRVKDDPENWAKDAQSARTAELAAEGWQTLSANVTPELVDKTMLTTVPANSRVSVRYKSGQ